MDNINLIREVTWSFAKKTTFEWDDLYSIACLNYAEALQSFDESIHVKFTTYAYSVMRNGLINHCKKELSQKNHFQRMPEKFEIGKLDRKAIELEEISKDWPECCKYAMNLVLENFEELDEIPPKFARGAIVRELRQRGWKWQQIWNTMGQMKDLIRGAEFTY